MLRPARASSMRRRRYSGAYGGCVRGMGNLLFYFSPIPSTKAGQLQTNRAAAVLRRCAMSLTRTRTALGAFYRRLAVRIGKPKAITATARKLALLVYRVLSGDLVYQDPGANAYHQLHLARELKSIRRRATQFGYDLIDRNTGEVLLNPVS